MNYQTLVQELLKSDSPQPYKPEKVILDLKFHGNIIKYEIYNTDNPENVADQILKQYNLPGHIRLPLVDKIQSTIQQLQTPKFQQSILNSTLQDKDESIQELRQKDSFKSNINTSLVESQIPAQQQYPVLKQIGHKQQKQNIYDRLYKDAELKKHKSQLFIEDRQENTHNKSQIYEKLYQESFKSKLMEPVSVSSPKLTKSQSDRLIQRLTYSKKHDLTRNQNVNEQTINQIKEHLGPEITPKTKMNEISKQLTKYQNFEASNAYQTELYKKRNQLEILEKSTSLVLYNKIQKELTPEEKIYYKEKILLNQELKQKESLELNLQKPKFIIEKTVVSETNEYGREEWKTVENIYDFKPKIINRGESKLKKNGTYIGEKEPIIPEQYSFTPEFQSKQLKQNEIRNKIISKLFM